MDLVSGMNDRLLFAVPKKGRLHEACLDLLSGSDVQFHKHNRLDITLVKNMPMALIFLPAADIPTFVGEGRVDLGITGRDQVAEHEAAVPPTENTGVEQILDLEFGKCKLQVQVPEKGEIQTPDQLVGKNIVTSFTQLSENYFRDLEIKASKQNGASANGEDAGKLKTNIKFVGGSVEAACALGVADGIVDLVESGETMRAAGLKAIATVVESSAILIRSKHPSDPALVEKIAKRIRGVITAQRYLLCSYNVPSKSLEACLKITPGRRAPTVSNLEGEDWKAVSVMIDKKTASDVMDDLAAQGADDILISKILNSRTS
ncbi:unnamed protein product [Zymoseptoria tritici ST99CH_3D7]|uniref:ATP phosphoribosyltransferase n=2 Tax=Zymoseptoria tritici TaxID=1047171 RepID=F9XFC0_ZYMTI|nr:ATP phosphoribosyltransferase [Zymoseptoria tritici IPO323]EGP86188.1 hypothetical protein MYCGRDRAFT_73860 [Zymoseptoria tritici IPO323]SMQ52351.1 unnamed protein product [Zymoseptoria tritici ST99CH_3D7]